MDGRIRDMETIQAQKGAETAAGTLLPLDEEGRELAEGKRWTLDVPEIRLDPLR